MERIKVGDNVVVLSGKYKKKTGTVKSVNKEDQTLVVDGICLIKKHIKPGKDLKNPNGGIVESFAPIHRSKVSIVDPKTGKPTRIKFIINDKGQKQRVSVKSGSLV